MASRAATAWHDRVDIEPADEVVERLMEPILSDLPFKDGDDVLLFVNGIGATLRKAAMAVISKTGGASGPLYGTFFMDAGKAAPNSDLTLENRAAMMRAGMDGVQKRGKAETGEKTMVDALVPAVTALDEAVSGDASWSEALTSAMDAAEGGMHATTPMIATKGRASYLGDRSKGHQDPGATSTYHLFAAAVDAESGVTA